MRQVTIKRRTCRAALPSMTSGNKEDADVQGSSKKEDDHVGMRRRMSSNDQEE